MKEHNKLKSRILKNITTYISLILTVITIFTACNNNKKKEKSGTNDTIDNNIPSYNKDSASDTVAVLLINPNGESEYIVGKIDNIYRKTSSGLEFKFIKSGKGNIYPKIGDILYFDMTYSTPNDSVIFNTNIIDPNFKMRLSTPSHSGGCFEEALMMMKEGDSAAFKINAKNFLIYTQDKVNIPSYLSDNDKFIFRIKLKEIVDGSDYIKQNADLYQYYISQENSLIERYSLEIEYPRKITESGLNIFTIKKGTGKTPIKGDMVSIDYTAGFIDGSVFDSTLERNQPFRFKMGNNEVIDGLEEAISLMNIGDHCLIIIPFRLAYGEEKNGVVAPFSTLVFEIEVLNVE